MIVELPRELEIALNQKALTSGITAETFVREMLSRELLTSEEPNAPVKPFKTSRGLLAKYGPAPTDEEMEENRRDMFRGFGERFD